MPSMETTTCMWALTPGSLGLTTGRLEMLILLQETELKCLVPKLIQPTINPRLIIIHSQLISVIKAVPDGMETEVGDLYTLSY